MIAAINHSDSVVSAAKFLRASEAAKTSSDYYNTFWHRPLMIVLDEPR